MQRLADIAATQLHTTGGVWNYMTEAARLVPLGVLSRHETTDLRWVTHRILASATSVIGLPRRKTR